MAARRKALVRFGYMLTGDVAAAEDLVQEALLRCLAGWHRLDPPGMESYVRKVMVRLAWRARRHTPHPVGSAEERPLDDIAQASAAAVDLRAALAALPTQQRIVLVLRYWQDLTEAEIADLVGCRRGTVKSRLSRGIVQLRSHLGSLNDSATPAAETKQPGQTRLSRWEDRP